MHIHWDVIVSTNELLKKSTDAIKHVFTQFNRPPIEPCRRESILWEVELWGKCVCVCVVFALNVIRNMTAWNPKGNLTGVLYSRFYDIGHPLTCCSYIRIGKFKQMANYIYNIAFFYTFCAVHTFHSCVHLTWTLSPHHIIEVIFAIVHGFHYSSIYDLWKEVQWSVVERAYKCLWWSIYGIICVQMQSCNA